jgi:hypothetical protein
LLLAPDPADDTRVLLPGRPGRAAAESHRRAIRRLAEIGFIELSWKRVEVRIKREKQVGPLIWDEVAGVYQDRRSEKIPVRRSIDKRAVRLTPLGALVVDRIRPLLETGERVRWDMTRGPAPK